MKLLPQIPCYSFLLLSIAVITFSSCDPYQKVLKSNDLDYKLTKAKEYYNKGDYFKAQPLFEELITAYKGTKSIEDISFYYAYCHYGMGNYILAAYYFKSFTKSHPVGDYTEEAQFQFAYCYYLSSPSANLDQTNTYKAIEAFQLFASLYPESERIEECNKLIDQMRRKLEMKALHNAKLYFDLEKYKAAAKYSEQILKDFPDIEEKEEIYFLTLRSFYYLAQNSVVSKKKERYQKALEAYYKFIDKFPTSKYIKDAEKMYSESAENIKKLG